MGIVIVNALKLSIHAFDPPYHTEFFGVKSQILQHEIGWTSIRRARKERSLKQNQFVTELIPNDLQIGVDLVDDTCAPNVKKFQNLMSTSLPAQIFRKEILAYRRTRNIPCIHES